jgi:hypothetical protein
MIATKNWWKLRHFTSTFSPVRLGCWEQVYFTDLRCGLDMKKYGFHPLKGRFHHQPGLNRKESSIQKWENLLGPLSQDSQVIEFF